MIPIVVFWTKYTAILHGRVVKLVPCENCSTEYVYVLERESAGVGTSVYTHSTMIQAARSRTVSGRRHTSILSGERL